MYVYIYSYSVTLLYIPRLMSESFYFSKDCLSRDKRRKGEIEERTSEILFIEAGIFERKFRSLERKTGEEEGKVFARQTPWRVLMPRICETQEENGNGRERERDSFRAKETSSAKTLPRTSESSRAIARVNIENSPLIERIFQKEREREKFEYFTFALETREF